ncbi:hypothetical protein Ancab_029909 [Ancistrocladus abbreviatus]
MSDNPYERVKGGRLTFKGGALATRSKTIEKKRKKKSSKNKGNSEGEKLEESTAAAATSTASGAVEGGGELIYTIDAAKKMKYEELFPVETKKFGYDPNAKSKSVEDALDDRVKKKADRYSTITILVTSSAPPDPKGKGVRERRRRGGNGEKGGRGYKAGKGVIGWGMVVVDIAQMVYHMHGTVNTVAM